MKEQRFWFVFHTKKEIRLLKVLLVEDEDLVRKALIQLTPWNDLGFELCGEAENGLIALNLFKELKPEIIISDIRMPVMDGIDFVKKAYEYVTKTKELCPEFIILSGYSEFEYARRALMVGVQEYLLKPVDEEELYEALERAKKRYLGLKQEKEEREALLFEKIQQGADDEKALDYVEKAIVLIHEKYVLGITIEEAAKNLGLSAGHLSRLFKQRTKKTFNEYLRQIRIEKAISLLKNQNLKVYEIADLVGYLDEKYFTQTFKKLTGFTPSEYRCRFFQGNRAIEKE